jgi:hypothetical protein
VVTTAKRRPKPRVFADGKGKWQGREPNPAVSGFVDQFVRWISANVLESVELTGASHHSPGSQTPCGYKKGYCMENVRLSPLFSRDMTPGGQPRVEAKAVDCSSKIVL